MKEGSRAFKFNTNHDSSYGINSDIQYLSEFRRQQIEEAGLEGEECGDLLKVHSRVLLRNGHEPEIKYGTLDPDIEEVSARETYAKGLKVFLGNRQINTREIGGYSNPESLINQDEVVFGYVDGLRREDIGVDRFVKELYRQRHKFGSGHDSINLPSPKVVAGWKLGFAVGVARDFDLSLNPNEIPDDNQGLNLFKYASKGGSMPVMCSAEIAGKQYRDNHNDNRLFLDTSMVDIGLYDDKDEKIYVAGQRAYVANLGISKIYSEYIRRPDVLESFKIAFENPDRVRPEVKQYSADMKNLLQYEPSEFLEMTKERAKKAER